MTSLLKKVWELMDGKKTLIGLLVVALSVLEAQIPGAVILLAEAVKQALSSTSGEVGAALTVVGLAHKAVKNAQK